MRKANQRFINSGIYARLRDIEMSEVDRQTALNALETAEALADAAIWAKNKVAALTGLFMRPSLKH